MSETRVNAVGFTDVRTAHQDLHSAQGALRGEHPGRSRNPVIKVADLAWLEFEKPDLDRAEVFARDFGFAIAARTESELWLRGSFAGSPCMVIRKGRAGRFIGPVFRAAERADLDRLARATGTDVQDADVPGGGRAVNLLDPRASPCASCTAARNSPRCPNSGRCCSTSAPITVAGMPRSARRVNRPVSSAWGMWCWRRGCSPGPWTGIWTRWA